jgi:CDP-diacylglycerol--glycerol-3-phosphate 3-phosphatidyltransferase
MVAIFLLLLGSRASNIEIIDLIGRIALWIAAILTLVTGYAYLKSSLRYIGQTK